ncbi:MAG: peptidylprolyl isomerase [Planctomycetes bacterium]|nr:peptidylprolyl isomerase [Planctomycetota bacterium]
MKPGAGTKAAPTAAPAATAPAADSPADRPPAAAPAPTGKRPDDDDPSPRVELKTSLGTIVLELDRARAPITVENFLHHVAAGYYEGTIFHRVIPTFMAQGGGYTQARKRKAPLRDPIRNESEGGLTNARGTIAMARSGDPDSATSQFFLNVVDNAYRLDFPKASGHGYAVFGKVVEGMDVVDRIRDSTIVDQGGAFKDCPEQDIVIESARRL